MSLKFSHILIPVDFSINTQIAVKKALWLSDPFNSVIHLLYILTPEVAAVGNYMQGYAFVYPLPKNPDAENAEIKLRQIKVSIQSSMPGIEVVTHVLPGLNIQHEIVSFANANTTNLIVIGKNKTHKWFPFLKTINSGTIAKQTNSAVLTVKPGALVNRMKTIVIPVGFDEPKRKIELLSALTRNQRPKIHLVTMGCKNDFNSKSHAFLSTYRTISEYLHYPVVYKMLRGNNMAKAVYQYASSVMADIIIANPNEETNINSINGAQINDLILAESKISVLTATPYFN